MIAANLNWNGDRVKQLAFDAGWEKLVRMTEFFWGHLLQALNVPNSGVRVKRRGGGTRTVYPNPSKPGEPPRKRTGWLQRHVQREYDKASLTSRVGVQRNALYGIFLELGTRRMAARPWLLATLNKVRTQLEAIAAN